MLKPLQCLQKLYFFRNFFLSCYHRTYHVACITKITKRMQHISTQLISCTVTRTYTSFSSQTNLIHQPDILMRKLHGQHFVPSKMLFLSSRKSLFNAQTAYKMINELTVNMYIRTCIIFIIFNILYCQ